MGCLRRPVRTAPGFGKHQFRQLVIVAVEHPQHGQLGKVQLCKLILIAEQRGQFGHLVQRQLGKGIQCS